MQLSTTETMLPCRLVQSIAGLAALTDVVHTHARVCTLKEMTGRVDVGERSFVSTAWMDLDVSVLETTLDYIFQHKIVGLGVHLCAHTVESMTARDPLSGGQGLLLEENGAYVVEKCSGFLPGISDSILPFVLMMTSCSILWLAENGFLCTVWQMLLPNQTLALD